MTIPDDVIISARKAYISILSPSDQWISEAVMEGLADASSEVQAAARAIMAEREAAARIIEQSDVPTRYILAAAIRKGE